MKLSLAATIWALTANAAAAFCPAPGRAPEPPRSYEKPKTPSCLANAGYNGENDCEPRELDRYRTQVDQYIRELEQYADEAQRFAEAADRYARCEADELREATR